MELFGTYYFLCNWNEQSLFRLWELGTNRNGDHFNDPQIKLFHPPAEGARPRSLDLVSTETQQLLTAYTGKIAGILDLETDQRILEFNLRELDEEVGEINKIISHPTMPITVSLTFMNY
jgi:hypothetical protein